MLKLNTGQESMVKLAPEYQLMWSDSQSDQDGKGGREEGKLSHWRIKGWPAQFSLETNETTISYIITRFEHSIADLGTND